MFFPRPKAAVAMTSRGDPAEASARRQSMSSRRGKDRSEVEYENLFAGDILGRLMYYGGTLTYLPPISDNVEEVERYRRGGYHPVEIGDELADGTYKITHKLGHGDFSTVWLAYDRKKSRFVAIKIVTADFSHEAMVKEERIQKSKLKIPLDVRKRFSLALGHFWITGVNGRHFAIVSDVRGPSLARLIQETAMFSDTGHVLGCSVAQKLASQITQAVWYMHELGIAHGDLTCNNVLLELKPLNHLQVASLIDKLGQPKAEKIRTIDQSSSQHAPEHIYEPADLLPLLEQWTGNIKIIDFGSSYSLNGLPNALNTPLTSCAPEYLLLNEVRKTSDIWALGVLIYRLRMRTALFAGTTGGSDEVLCQMEEVLGPIPYRTSASPSRSLDSERTLPGELPRSGILQELILRAWWASFKRSMIKDHHGISQVDQKKAKSISEDTLAPFEDLAELQLESKDDVNMNTEEAWLFLDLMTRVLDYDAKRRLSADGMLNHPWFLRRC